MNYGFIFYLFLLKEKSSTLSSKILLSKQEVENIKIGIDKINILLSNNFINSILNQEIYYLTISLEYESQHEPRHLQRSNYTPLKINLYQHQQE